MGIKAANSGQTRLGFQLKILIRLLNGLRLDGCISCVSHLFPV